MRVKVCAQCGENYSPHPACQAKQQYCSYRCSGLATARQLGRSAPEPKVKGCECCGQPFIPLDRIRETQRFCSKSCARRCGAPRVSQKIAKQCEHCGADYLVVPFFYEVRRFCSRACWRLHSVGPENGAWKGGTGWYKKQRKEACERCGSDRHLMVHHRDEDRANNALENLETLCRGCHQRHHRLIEKMRKQGVDSPDKLVKHRNPQHTEKSRYPYKKWRKAVIARDNHTCRECGQQRQRMYAHHVKSWQAAPDLRYVIENGITLCYHCHHAKHPEIWPSQ